MLTSNNSELQDALTSPDYSTEALLYNYLLSSAPLPQVDSPESTVSTLDLVSLSSISLANSPQSAATTLDLVSYCPLSLINSPQSIPTILDVSTPGTIATSTNDSCLMDVDNPLDVDGIHLYLDSFSDLQSALKDINGRNKLCQLAPAPKPSAEEDLAHQRSSEIIIPSSVKQRVESTDFLDILIHEATSNWCCIGFKVAPISRDLIQNWRRAPLAIVYCIASISLVSLGHGNASQDFVKGAAMAFYEKARHKMDDILFEDIQPLTIQAYFCLSYTSNLLRLYEHQRTWGGLASIALQQRVQDTVNGRKPMDELTLHCWFRWYYVDAWMCLAMNRECLLPDEFPLIDTASDEQGAPYDGGGTSNNSNGFDFRRNLFQFANLTRYMRRYIRAMRSGNIFANHSNGDYRCPSHVYYGITQQLKDWYDRQRRVSNNACSGQGVATQMSVGSPSFCPGVDVHLHLCYNAMRLVVLFQFLQPTLPPPNEILIDCLDTNLSLLQSLQHLKDSGCDQSTYHHMFFAIHNTAKRIFQYGSVTGRANQFRPYAQDQLRINLTLLRGTQAYANDVYQARVYVEKIEEICKHLEIPLVGWLGAPSGANQSGFTVFRLQSKGAETSRTTAPNTPSKKRAKKNHAHSVPSVPG
ncbi:hypothetical protein DFQ28_005195 [Apophysomyces sp. BC1034]|nr:hypothetical protein DFQ30_005080 [Apophysomyces sp. BC1015]KAG0177998.1 hypothetical protein DFQ29_004090 [Apophysomyces sp. BC1021]KAG0188237.1 hypothetical protein DFQ28_005195 [Apophysomyces sp. BC1034]